MTPETVEIIKTVSAYVVVIFLVFAATVVFSMVVAPAIHEDVISRVEDVDNGSSLRESVLPIGDPSQDFLTWK